MITKLEIQDIEPGELQMLIPSIRAGSEDWSYVTKAIVDGTAAVWRLEQGRAKGILITQVVDDMLWIWHFAGNGLWRHARTLMAELKAMVVNAGLKGIQGQSIPELVETWKALGFTTPRTVVEWRVENG